MTGTTISSYTTTGVVLTQASQKPVTITGAGTISVVNTYATTNEYALFGASGVNWTLQNYGTVNAVNVASTPIRQSQRPYAASRLDGSFALGTAPVSIATVQVDAGATLSGVGTVSSAVIDSGSVEAVGGTLTVGGAVSATGILTTEAGSALDLRTGSTLTETIIGAGTLQLDGAFTLGAQPLAVATVLVDPGAKLSGAGTFAGALIDNGSVTAAGGTLTLAGGLSGTGVLGVNTGAVLDLAGPNALAETATGAGGLRIDAAIDFAGSSIKTATTQIDAGGALSGVGTVASALSVAGTLGAVCGTLSLRGGVLTNLSHATLTGGAFVVDTNSTLQLADNTTVATDAATIVLNGSASAIQSLDTKTKQELSLRATLATIASGGVLNLLGGRTFIAGANGGVITDNGQLLLGTGTFAGANVVLGAVGIIAGYGAVQSAITDGGSVTATGGTLVVSGGVTGAGTLPPPLARRSILPPGAPYRRQ